jgi:tRNA 2-thiocytidine biosynthesis protein TtcA
MRDWEKRFPGRVDHIFASLSRITPSHLMDRTRFDFASIEADGEARPDGDLAFDPDPTLRDPESVVTVFPAQ